VPKGIRKVKRLNRSACDDIWVNYYSGREMLYQRGLPSMARLGQLYGVSHATIRRIIRGEYSLKDGTTYQGTEQPMIFKKALEKLFIVKVTKSNPCSWARKLKHYIVFGDGNIWVLYNDKLVEIGARRILRKEHCEVVMECVQ